MAIARTSLRRVPTRRRVAVILRRAGATPHLPARTPHRAALTPRLAAVMVAEAVVAAEVVAEAEARGAAGAAAEARGAAGAAALEAVEEDRTEAVLTGTELFRLQPAPILGRVFFVLDILRDSSSRNS
jgi:hypothetical protein